MLLRRLLTITALVVTASLSLSDRAHANYDTSTSVASIVDPGGGLLQQFPVPPPANATFTDPRLGTQLTPAGYATFVDGGGSTVYLVNQVLTNVSGTSGVNESIFVSTPAGVTDNSTWTINLLVAVRNLTGVGPVGQFGNGSNVAISATYVVSSTSPGGGSFGSSALPSYIAPTSIIVGPNSFTLGLPGGATGGNVNGTTNNGGISGTITTGAIPEPASVVMLGCGLAGVIGLGLRRKKKLS